VLGQYAAFAGTGKASSFWGVFVGLMRRNINQIGKKL
jgi:hypothetical protein